VVRITQVVKSSVLNASGAAEADRDLLAVDDHGHVAASAAPGEHPLQICGVLLDVDVLERDTPPCVVLTGGLGVRSGVFAEDEHRIHGVSPS
jgi:hypothetical protein